MASTQRTNGYEAFVGAYLAFRKRNTSLDDPVDYYARRYKAFCSVLKLDFGEESKDFQNRSDCRTIDDVTRYYSKLTTPFAGCCEASGKLMRLAGPYEDRFRAMRAEQEQLCVALLCEFVEAIRGPCKRQIQHEERVRHGASDASEPRSHVEDDF